MSGHCAAGQEKEAQKDSKRYTFEAYQRIAKRLMYEFTDDLAAAIREQIAGDSYMDIYLGYCFDFQLAFYSFAVTSNKLCPLAIIINVF